MKLILLQILLLTSFLHISLSASLRAQVEFRCKRFISKPEEKFLDNYKHQYPYKPPLQIPDVPILTSPHPNHPINDEVIDGFLPGMYLGSATPYPKNKVRCYLFLVCALLEFLCERTKRNFRCY
jgi:hypothetical protein